MRPSVTPYAIDSNDEVIDYVSLQEKPQATPKTSV